MCTFLKFVSACFTLLTTSVTDDASHTVCCKPHDVLITSLTSVRTPWYTSTHQEIQLLPHGAAVTIRQDQMCRRSTRKQHTHRSSLTANECVTYLFSAAKLGDLPDRSQTQRTRRTLVWCLQQRDLLCMLPLPERARTPAAPELVTVPDCRCTQKRSPCRYQIHRPMISTSRT